MAGTLVSMSVLQGGPGFPTLTPVIYDYITKDNYAPSKITNDDVPDFQVRALLNEVCYILEVLITSLCSLSIRLKVHKMKITLELCSVQKRPSV